MKYNPKKRPRPSGRTQSRRSLRLQGYDYTRAGAYFVTACTYQRQSLFGDVVDGEMVLSDVGRIVRACWAETPNHFPHVELDAFVVMPNHIHGIIVIVDDPVVGATHASPQHTSPQHTSPQPASSPHTSSPHASPLQPVSSRPRGPKSGSLGAIVGSFKSAVSRQVNQWRNTPGQPVWQRNYYEHVIRNESTLNRIRHYIETNPLRWALDRENPRRQGSDDFDRWLATIGARQLPSQRPETVQKPS